MHRREITAHDHNHKLINEITREITKESDCTQVAGACLERICQKITDSPINMLVKYWNDKVRPNRHFDEQQGAILMNSYDE